MIKTFDLELRLFKHNIKSLVYFFSIHVTSLKTYYYSIIQTGSVQICRNLSHLITKLLVMYSVIHIRVFPPPWELPTPIIEAIDHSSNQLHIDLQIVNVTPRRNFRSCKSIYYWWVGRMINSLYYSGRNISERCENSFVNYRIHYRKHFLFITIYYLNSAGDTVLHSFEPSETR